MKRIIRIAAALVVVAGIAALLAVLKRDGGGRVAFADVVRPILTARTATFTLTVEVEGAPPQTFKGMFMEPARLRQTVAGGMVQIMDGHQGKMMTLIPAQKMAIVVEMANMPEEDREGQINMFQAIRESIREAQESEDESVEFFEQEIEGVPAIGYHVQKPGLDITIWANAETLLPIRIEQSTPAMMGKEATVIWSNIAFDVELDESLFSLEVPDDYTVQTMQVDASKPSEEDLIETFRLWTEVTEGKFPSALDMSAMGPFVKALEKEMGFELGKGQEPSQEQMQEILGMFAKITRGITFAHTMPAASDWHYAGKDAVFGDAHTPIFWYRPEGSQTYRVIYADLSVKELAPQDLPKESAESD